MNYQVEWGPEALQALAHIWTTATNRSAVAAASHAIDVTLAANPHATGVVVFDTVREYSHPLLGVEFEVIDADRRVWVLTVWDATTGRPTITGN